MLPDHKDKNESCDLFDVTKKNIYYPHKAISQKLFKSENGLKFLLLTLSLLLVFGLVIYYFTRETLPSKPIIITPSTEPLKIQIDSGIKINDDDENIIYDKLRKPSEKRFKDTRKKNQVIKKNTLSANSGNDIPQTVNLQTYYITVGTFKTHYDASLRWQQLKVDMFEDFKGLEPIIRNVPSSKGIAYQLLAGPVPKDKGLGISKKIGNKSSLISVDYK